MDHLVDKELSFQSKKGIIQPFCGMGESPSGHIGCEHMEFFYIVKFIHMI